MSDQVRIQPGDVVDGKYRVEQVLGEGGMGFVVKATHLLLDEPVALKFLLPDLARHPAASARFIREAKAALRVKGDHIAQLFDVSRLDSGEPYIVMEYLSGSDLGEQVATRGPLPIAEAVGYVRQACSGVSKAHAAGIVHRDLKPSNLYLTRDHAGAAIVKILDFGISKVDDAEGRSLTRTDTAMGSAPYMSPEQMRSARDVDGRTDIYALGVTLYELLAARLPFDGATVPEIVAAALEGVAPALSAVRPDVPSTLAEVVHRAMARDPSERFPSAAALADALAPFAGGAVIAPAAMPTPRPQLESSDTVGGAFDPPVAQSSPMVSAPMVPAAPPQVGQTTVAAASHAPITALSPGAYGPAATAQTAGPVSHAVVVKTARHGALPWVVAGGVLLLMLGTLAALTQIGGSEEPASRPAAGAVEESAPEAPAAEETHDETAEEPAPDAVSTGSALPDEADGVASAVPSAQPALKTPYRDRRKRDERPSIYRGRQ